MNMMKSNLHSSFVSRLHATGALAMILLLAACSSNVERRTVGTVIYDQSAEIQILDTLFSRPEFDNRDHIKVEAHNETLLLAGEVSSESKKALATKLASEMKSVSRVVNELDVMPPSTTSERLHNSYVTSKINSKLVAMNPIEGSDTGRIKVIARALTVKYFS